MTPDHKEGLKKPKSTAGPKSAIRMAGRKTQLQFLSWLDLPAHTQTDNRRPLLPPSAASAPRPRLNHQLDSQPGAVNLTRGGGVLLSWQERPRRRGSSRARVRESPPGPGHPRAERREGRAAEQIIPTTTNKY